MSEEQNAHLEELAEAVEEALEPLSWVKKGAKDARDVKKIIRSRKKMDLVVEAYATFSDAIEQLDFDDDDNNVWFERWRGLKAEVSEVQARMERSVAVAAHDEDDPFADDDANDPDKPSEEGIQASLDMAEDIKRTMDNDIKRLADILRVTEDLKQLADQCLEEIQSQRTQLMRINSKLKAIDKDIERAQGTLEKIKANMAANKCCWAVGCTIIWLVVILIIAVAVTCTQDNLCAIASSPTVTTIPPTTTAPAATAATTTAAGRLLRG